MAVFQWGKINIQLQEPGGSGTTLHVFDRRCKSNKYSGKPSFNLTNVDHLYVNHLFVMFLLATFFPLSRFAFFGIGAVVIHIGCHFCSISQKQTPPQQRRRREKMANEIEKEQSASESSTDKNNPVRARNRCISFSQKRSIAKTEGKSE